MFNDDDDYLFLVLIEKIVICSYMIAQFLLTVTGTSTNQLMQVRGKKRLN